jgi:hypothetical protein
MKILFSILLALVLMPSPSPSPTPFCHPCVCAMDPFGWEECHELPTPKATPTPPGILVCVKDGVAVPCKVST